jgi:hypothetical protein
MTSLNFVKNAFESEVRTIVLIKPIYQDPHSVIPQLNAAIMKGCGEERLRRVKSEPCRRFERRKMQMDHHEGIPLTRLLLDSNFVSITDMITRNRENVQCTLVNEMGPERL